MLEVLEQEILGCDIGKPVIVEEGHSSSIYLLKALREEDKVEVVNPKGEVLLLFRKDVSLVRLSNIYD